MRVPVSRDEYVEIPLLKFAWVPLVIALLFLGMSMVYQVDAEAEGVRLRFGEHVETVGPGLHFKAPYPIETVEIVPTKIVDVLEFGYRSRGKSQSSGSDSRFDEESSMLTGDLNIVLAGFDVQFSRRQPTHFLFNVKDPVNTLRDISQSVMRKIMGDRASIPILTVARAEIQVRARELIQDYVDEFEMGIRVNEVNLSYVDPPRPVRSAFNDLNKAEQDATRYLEEASRKYQEKVPKARGSAKRTILEAEGYRERRVRTARGEASRFAKMLQNYRAAPEITRRRLYFENLETQIPKLKEVVVVDETSPGLLPLLNLREGSQAK